MDAAFKTGSAASSSPASRKAKKFSRHAVDCANQVSELLKTVLSDHVPVQKLARKIGINRRTLNDCFRQVYGMSVFAYGQHMRLEHGKKLLLDESQSIQAIAEACGYPEQANFGTAFKRKYGVGPGEWRKTGELRRI